MPAPEQQHHHRSTTKTVQKSFKPRFTSKNALKDRAKGKIETEKDAPRRTRNQEVMSKFDRKNQAKQKRINKHQDHILTTSVFSGRDAAPRIVAIVPLCSDVSAQRAAEGLNKSLDLEHAVSEEGLSLVHIDRFKQKLQYVTIRKDLLSAMDACRLADYVVFVLSATEEVDEDGEAIIKSIEGQGVSNVYTVVQDLDRVQPPKRRPQIVSSLRSFITHYFPMQEKVFSLDSPQECQNLLRSLCTTSPKGIKWREERSWMIAEDVRWIHDDSESDTDGTATAILTATVRGRSLKPDRLLQIGDWGDFQIIKIVAAPPVSHQTEKTSGMALDSDDKGNILDQPTEDQDTLDQLAPEETVMHDVDVTAPSMAASTRKGVLLDDHHYFSDGDEDEAPQKPKRLPWGTSNYQSAWYIGDESDSGSDMEDVDEDPEDFPMADSASRFDPLEYDAAPALVGVGEAGPSEYPQSEAFMDASLRDAAEARELAAYRAKKKLSEAVADLDFPDEIELHPEVLARERLARYRGLKSSRTSPWLTEEDLPHQPADWARLLEIRDYRAAKNRVLRETLAGGVRPGTRVQIHVRDVPLMRRGPRSPVRPLGVFSLLRHEHKHAPVDYSITLSSEHSTPLKSKDELIVQVGPRRFAVNPLFSQGGNTPNDVHKFERYLHPGRTAIASFVAPLLWGAVPVLYFKSASTGHDAEAKELAADMDVDGGARPPAPRRTLELIGHGTIQPSTPSRVIAKRIVLTGQPYKINKRVVTVRYMFFNKEDVDWFKALRLFTNCGKQGAFKESLGTHGYFKAAFEGGVGMMDSVGIALWKRVWPRPARLWSELDLDDEPLAREAGGEAVMGL